MRMKVSDYIAQKLVDEGITDAFMVTGGGAMHLDDGLGHQPGLHCYFNHHEQACAIAAEAYARIHNKIAALCVTTGPGGTNAITGVVGGWLDSIPMLVLSGQVRYDTTAHSTGLGIRAMGDQEFEITKAIDCMTKYSEMVLDPMRIRFCLEKSLYLAQTGRPGPCWLDIPLNVQGAYIETEALLGFDKDDYEAGGTGWSGHGTGCSGCAPTTPTAPAADPPAEGSAGNPSKNVIRVINNWAEKVLNIRLSNVNIKQGSNSRYADGTREERPPRNGPGTRCPVSFYYMFFQSTDSLL